MRVPVSFPAQRKAGPDGKRVYVEQYGCATTQGEAQIIRGILESRGHALVERPEDADTAVLVTCTVVDRTERNMLRRLDELAATGTEVVVSGCMASAQPDLLAGHAPAARVLAPQFVHEIGDVVEGFEPACVPGHKTGLPKKREGVIDTVIMNEGCSGKCSFCITKLARPGLRSAPVRSVVDDVRAAVDAGCVEIRLTSQDSGAYGLDTGTSLAALLNAITRDVPGDYGLRVGMLNPWTLVAGLDALVDAFDDPRVFKFLHVPVQSGSERVLRAMRRNHRVADVTRAVDRFRERFPDLVVSTDVICGFPGETDDEFRETLALCERLQPEIINITRFSPRTGTPAADLKPLPGHVLKARSGLATDLRYALSTRLLAKWVGRETTALVVEHGKPGTVLARTPEYRQVVLPAAGRRLGERVRVRITESRWNDLSGVVVDA